MPELVLCFFLLPWPIHVRAVALCAAFNASFASALHRNGLKPAAHGAASFVASRPERLLPWRFFAQRNATALVC
jgi:hypothetical protein